MKERSEIKGKARKDGVLMLKQRIVATDEDELSVIVRYNVKGKRQCLARGSGSICGKWFDSFGPGNRRCPKCRKALQRQSRDQH